MQLRSTSLVLALLGVLLAGCSDEPAKETEVTSKEDILLNQQLGAIAGLLVDDRFRPLEVSQKKGDSEYSFEGFLLLQETGSQMNTNENGEFFAIDLEPGTYTIRAQIDGHEATPLRIQVSAGELAEASMVARRKASTDPVIITDEYSALVTCSLHALAYSANPECTGDQSGDSNRFSIFPDYTGYTELSSMKVEFLMNQNAANGYGFSGTVRLDPEFQEGLDYQTYTNVVIKEGNYGAGHLFKGQTSDDPVPVSSEFVQWDNEFPMQIALFGKGALSDEIAGTIAPACEPLPEVPMLGKNCLRRGVGAQLGIKAQIMVSAFLYEPEQDIHTYCVLC